MAEEGRSTEPVRSHGFGRRELLTALGASGAGIWFALADGPAAFAAALTHSRNNAARASLVDAARCAKPTPELTAGPYWVNTMLRRSDVRANTSSAKTSPGVGQAGVTLLLTINVVDLANGCKPLDGVAVDIWHANAHGVYSDESSQQAGGGTSGGDTSGQNFLRGYQITGKDRGLKRAPVPGQVSFKTIWPGWYAGRAVHIHVRVRKLSTTGATIAGYTTQVFFSDADNDRVLTGAAPYKARSPKTDPTTDENDNVLQRSDRATNIVPVTGSIEKAFAATFNIGLHESDAAAKGSLARPNGP